MLLSTVMSVALASTCPVSTHAASDWSYPNSEEFCGDFDSVTSGKERALLLSACPRKIEAEMLRRSKGRVRRGSGLLRFETPLGNSFELRDKVGTRYERRAYSYRGSARGFHLIRMTGYEHVAWILVHEETGQMTRLYSGLPLLSPSAKWVVSAMGRGIDGGQGDRMRFTVWGADGDGFEEVFRTQAYGDVGGHPSFQWISDEHLQVCWVRSAHRDGSVAVEYIHDVRFDGTAWRRERAPGRPDSCEAPKWWPDRESVEEKLEASESVSAEEFHDPRLIEKVKKYFAAFQSGDVGVLLEHRISLSDDVLEVEARKLQDWTGKTDLVRYRVHSVEPDPTNPGHVRVQTAVVLRQDDHCTETVFPTDWILLRGTWFTFPIGRGLPYGFNRSPNTGFLTRSSLREAARSLGGVEVPWGTRGCSGIRSTRGRRGSFRSSSSRSKTTRPETRRS